MSNKVYFEVIPTVSNYIAIAAEAAGVKGDTVEARLTNIVHSELGKLNIERTEAKTGKTAGQWAKLKLKDGKVDGSQSVKNTLSLATGQTISQKVVDLYRFSASTVKYVEDNNVEYPESLPVNVSGWIDAVALKVADDIAADAKAKEDEKAAKVASK